MVTSIVSPRPARTGTFVAMLLGMTALLSAIGVAQKSAAGKPLIDNQRVTVWDTTQGISTPDDQDVVTIDLSRGTAAGTVRFLPRGGTAAAPAPGIHRIVIALKPAGVPPLPNTSGVPLAFPRPRSRMVLANDRVVVWDYTWTSGVATPMHFHDKDVVVTYLADGALQSTDPRGQTIVNPHTYGFTKFNPRDRVHTETLIRGEARAIIVELK